MKRCQKCLSENEDSMSFCWECGTPLPNLIQNTANTEELPTQSIPSTPTVFGGNQELKAIGANRFNLVSKPSHQKPSKSKTFLIVGGIGALLVLGLIAVAGIVVYKLMPKKDIVTLKPTTTASLSPSPKTTPDVSFTPPIEPTKQASFTIYANRGWQLSDISTVPLEQFSTTVQGKIDLAGIKTNVSPKGVSDVKTKSRRIHSELPTGALLMRTRYADGKYSNVVSMMTNGANGTWQNYPEERGKIEFCINDNAPESNSGEFTVNVTFTSLPKTKKK